MAEANQGELQLTAGGEEALAEEQQQQPGKDGGRRRGRGGSQAEQPAMEEVCSVVACVAQRPPRELGGLLWSCTAHAGAASSSACL